MAISVDQLVTAFCDDSQLPDTKGLTAILRSSTRKDARIEENRLDLKRTFANDTRSWPALCKDIVAMHNSGGGVLLLGVDNAGNRFGLTQSLVSALDPANISNKARRYHVSGQFRTSYVEHTSYHKVYGFLFVHAGPNVITFDKDVQVDKPGSAPDTIARAGMIYVRRSSATVPAQQNDLDALMSRMLGRGVRAFLARIERVANLPASTQLIAQTPGSSGGYVLTAAGQGVPVTVVGPDAGAAAIELTEAVLPDLPLSSVDAEVVGQLRQFRADNNHRAQRATLNRWYLMRSQVTLPTGAAEFLMLSALDERGFPFYWAAAVPRTRLSEFVSEQVARDKYPCRESLPYLVGAFFWDLRESILQPVRDRPVATRVIQATDRARFLRGARLGNAVSGQIDGKRISLNELYSDAGKARAMFDELVSHDAGPSNKGRQIAHQLDLWLHAPRQE